MQREDPRLATDIDRHIGNLIRLRRLAVGLSQEKLAATLGITSQQVQKYESGANRITVGRLGNIATALGVRPTYFFVDERGKENLGASEFVALMESVPGSAKMMTVLARLPPSIQQQIFDLVQSLVDLRSS